LDQAATAAFLGDGRGRLEAEKTFLGTRIPDPVPVSRRDQCR